MERIFLLNLILRQIKRLLQGVSSISESRKAASRILRLIVETGTITGIHLILSAELVYSFVLIDSVPF